MIANAITYCRIIISMLMTVLKGPLAVKQSKALIRTFKKMKDYILENLNLIGPQSKERRNYDKV